MLLGEDPLVKMGPDAAHEPADLVRSVFLLNGLVGESLVLLEEGVEEFVATHTWGYGLQLIVVPLLSEDILDLRAGPSSESGLVNLGAACANEDAIRKCSVSRLTSMAINAELVVRVSEEEGLQVLLEFFSLGEL